jgi:hypothetical protein
MPKTAPIFVPKSRRRRPISKRMVLLGLVTLLAVAGIAGYSYLTSSASRMLRSAKAQAALDLPGWTSTEVEAARSSIPNAENSAFQVQKSFSLMIPTWPSRVKVRPGALPRDPDYDMDDVLTRVAALSPENLMGVGLSGEVRADLTKMAEAVIEARKLAAMPRGRFPINPAQNPIMTLLPHLQLVRSMVRLLQADADLRAEDGDIDGALESCRAILNTARSIGDEPFLISQLVRFAVDSVATQEIQRVLAQGEASEAALGRLQAALAENAKADPIIAGMRGERAWINDVMEKMTSGEINMAGVTGAGFPGNLPLPTAFFQYNHALLLNQLNRAVEIAKMPDREQLAAWTELNESSKPPDKMVARMLGALNYTLGPALNSVGYAHLRHQAMFSSAISIVAAERHRIAHGTLPESYDQIDPKFRAGLMGDPYVGGPLKFKIGDGKILMYSVGQDGKDNRGEIEKRNTGANGTDLGLSLWMVENRRKPSPSELPKNAFQSTGKSKEADEFP